MRDVFGVGIWLVSLVLACGGAAPGTAIAPRNEPKAQAAAPATTPSSATATQPTATEPATVEATAPKELPTTCEKKDDLCLPPRTFVKRLCQGAYPGAAIRLFEKSSPFSRGYVRVRSMQPVNTLGGPASDAALTFGEEVLVLTRTGAAQAGDMQMSGMGGYDVLRWDGTCATLADGELARYAPTAPRNAPIAWQYIDTNIQQALLENQGIDKARKTQRKHCQGASLGRRSASCIDADAKLNERIVLAVRTGMNLPAPERLP